MTEPLNIDEIEPWLAQCPSCDAGLPMACTHPEGDYRPVMARLVAEIERLRSEGAAPNDIEATGRCCCAGCVGMGPCDRDTVEWVEPRSHRPVEGDEFMAAHWCGGCDACGYRPAPMVCVGCSYDEAGRPLVAVAWPCTHHLRQEATRECC